MTRGRAISLGSAAGLLAVLVLAEFLAGSLRLNHIAAPPPIAAATLAQAAAIGEIGAPPEAIDTWSSLALARPLMTQSRRPSAAPTTGYALANGLPRLAGTLIKADGPVAIFARDDAGHAVIARQGDTIGPYRIAHIEPGSVTVEGPSGAQVLHPKFDDQDADGAAGPLMPPINMPGTLPPNLPQPTFQRDPDQQNSD